MTGSRRPDYEVADSFHRRWSPRSFTDAAISDNDLFTCFEAARWAPSAFNAQPWRLLYAKHGTRAWAVHFSLLAEFNQIWAKSAAALVLFAGETQTSVNGEQRASLTYGFDTGAAWSNFAHKALLLGWHTHAMAGFDHEAARRELKLPNALEPIAMVAVGRLGPIIALPDFLQRREAPSTRNPITLSCFEGSYPTPPA